MCRIRTKLLLGAAALIGALALGAPPTWAVDETTLFELDAAANAVDDPVPTGGGANDWANIYAGPNSAAATTGIVNDVGTPNEDIYTGGKTKDIYDLDQWKWKSAAGFPDKNDITDAYAAAYICPASTTGCTAGDLIVYFGADRFDNSGDAFMAFWFFKNHITKVPGTPAGSFSGVHAVGDILVLVQYPQGTNASPIIRVLKWVASGGSVTANLDEITVAASKCDGVSDASDVCANTNHVSTASPWTYVPKGASGDSDFPFETFYEGGINITNLVQGSTCFASFLAETRSSESVTATLKDFALHDLPICGIRADKACTFKQVDGTRNFTYTATVTVTNTGALKIPSGTQFTIDDTPQGVPGDTDDPANITLTLASDLAPNASVDSDPIDFNSDLSGPTNTATVTGTIGGTTQVSDTTDEVTCPAPQVSPALYIQKDCKAVVLDGTSGTSLVPVVHFTGRVCNTGDFDLKVDVSDDPTVTGLPQDLVLGAGTLCDTSADCTGTETCVGASTNPPKQGVCDDGSDTDGSVCRSFAGSYTATDPKTPPEGVCSADLTTSCTSGGNECTGEGNLCLIGVFNPGDVVFHDEVTATANTTDNPILETLGLGTQTTSASANCPLCK